MTSLQIPLDTVPSQSISVVLNNQRCIIKIREMLGRQYLSLSSNGTIICQNVLMQNNFPIIKTSYLGFVGDFIVVDLSGDEPPIYTGWGDRWVLLYIAG